MIWSCPAAQLADAEKLLGRWLSQASCWRGGRRRRAILRFGERAEAIRFVKQSARNIKYAVQEQLLWIWPTACSQ